MNDIKSKLLNSKTQFIRILWCDNANIIRAKALHINTLKNMNSDSELSVGISRAQQGVPVIYDGVVADSGLDPVGEIILKGDLSTLTHLPYAPGHSRVIGDMIENGEVWDNCPRGFLKKMISDAQEEGLEIKSAFENEFYLLKQADENQNDYEPSDFTPFASTYSMDQRVELIGEIVESLIAQNVHVEQYYPESGPGQHEITVKYDHALQSADNQIVFRETVKATSYKNRLRASFLPSIFPNTAGSGCHIHISLWKNQNNILHDSKDKYGLSKISRQFIAGILHHLPALMAITTPIPRSYLRIRPQMWSGAFQVWGFNNREAAIRVIREDNGNILHFELKTVDASSNPYLALGAVIAAGMDGIRENIELPEPVQKDPCILTSNERNELGIEPLPDNLGQALDNLEKDEVLLNAMGEKLSKSYLAVKNAEYEYLLKLAPEKELEILLEKY
ncbi:MAG: glutamine synthetase [Methanobacteriales archaeon HGW-Methanobacteriales-1]|nr:MAG: glutamine synthetase [Methanobacteriales archaeon HGW-Methanobacteriales-1]